MSNSGPGGVLLTQELYVQVPLSWLLGALEIIEDSDDLRARDVSEMLTGYLPPVPTAFVKERQEREANNGRGD